MSDTTSENPVCASREEPPPAASEGLGDPGEPHPDEPGAPDDSPAPRAPEEAGDEKTAV